MTKQAEKVKAAIAAKLAENPQGLSSAQVGAAVHKGRSASADYLSRMVAEKMAYRLTINANTVLYFATPEARGKRANELHRKPAKPAAERFTAGSSRQKADPAQSVIPQVRPTPLGRYVPTGPVPRVVDSSQCRAWAQYA